jgi:hypothetical protein
MSRAPSNPGKTVVALVPPARLDRVRIGVLIGAVQTTHALTPSGRLITKYEISDRESSIAERLTGCGRSRSNGDKANHLLATARESPTWDVPSPTDRLTGGASFARRAGRVEW